MHSDTFWGLFSYKIVVEVSKEARKYKGGCIGIEEYDIQ